MIFYFTGTGNSLYAAKQLRDELYSIPQVIHQRNLCFSDKKIGIVCPVYSQEMPNMVKEFLRRSSFGTEYFFVILICSNSNCGAPERAENYLKDIGIDANYINCIRNVDNDLQIIREDIENRKSRVCHPAKGEQKIRIRLFESKAKISADDLDQLLSINRDCIGCGICTRVCPAGCFQLKEQRACRSGAACQQCMACIQNCPMGSIQLTVPEKNQMARYHNPNIRLTEIVKSNDQSQYRQK